ncbi:hydrolase [Gordoniibacillus kamchatkensis]|uniref:Hydrolase n=1 Tax=Gordoniibacillus kamchatkensis TaxID=1590651 RepID=A0ABR5AHA7_9BACL|nr:MBL fold metallo-hydrolase [Paenibacillus sp. VKM B-2647]KIL40282.1 hydrolase [Paenibacillus sp. VKM B-2647]
MQHVIEHEDEIVQVKVPLPFPLRWVNAYMIKGSGGYTVIDPGLHTAEAEECWNEALRERGVGYRDIERIVLTHYHPDHYGLAGWMQERSGAPVLMSSLGHRLSQLLWGERAAMTDALTALFAEHGMDIDMCGAMEAHMDSFVAQVTPQPRVTFLEPGETVRLGGELYRAIHTPGHAAGHLCFYHAAKRRIFCGDHVLPHISPNVAWMPGVEENPLASFLLSLHEVAQLPVERAFPGHRDPFAAFTERALELVAHHEERLELMLGRLGEPLSAYALCLSVFGERLTVHQLRFALAETLAHLVYLEGEGRAVRKRAADGTWQFRATGK